MFVFSCKTTKKQLFCVGLCVLLAIGVLSTGALRRQGAAPTVKTPAADAGIAYLQSCGYTAKGGELTDIQIPETIDNTVAMYAKAAGIDITTLLGKTVQCRNYTVTNHPDGAATAQVYFYKDTIAAATLTVDGKLYPLKKDVKNGTAG